MSTDTDEEHRAASRVDQPTTSAAALTAMGIVYGDLGTSPLDTPQAVAQTFDGGLSPSAALGSLSLIFWLLIITVSIKYCLFVMRADNHGEGGILALMLLTRASWHGRGRALVIMGLFGAALIYGDGIITPAISVLSALEGLNQATEVFKPHVMPMAVVVLLALFAVQSRGTARIGKAFGPVMLVWFATIAVLGVGGILHRPGVLAAVNPAHALGFLLENPRIGVLVLGAAFLAITGAEALYADMGHIGRNPIRTVWYCVVLPALLLNYAGQTALYLDDPALTGNPFFRLVPQWAIYPMVLLATLATIIASQAIITGTFSMTGHAARLVSRRAHPADLGPGIRPDLRAVRELDHDGLDHRANHRLRELGPAGRRLWHRGIHHDAAHDRPALPRHARALGLVGARGARGRRHLHPGRFHAVRREPR